LDIRLHSVIVIIRYRYHHCQLVIVRRRSQRKACWTAAIWKSEVDQRTECIE
jgi:hypothetical protein